MRDIDAIIEQFLKAYPSVSVAQLQVKHPGADDDGLWFFSQPGCPFEAQIESSTRMCPFLIETDEDDRRITVGKVAGVIEVLANGLHLEEKSA